MAKRILLVIEEVDMGLGVWVLIAAGSGLLLWLGWMLLMRSFVRRYFVKNYAPIPLEDAQLGDFPSSYHLHNVPWFSTREAYCQANTLQMIAHQLGHSASRDQVNFLMGFTYGACALPRGGFLHRTPIGFSPFTDPESGHAIAAPYLGLERRYYVTRDPKQYLRALRFYLSRGYPLHLPLDYGILYSRKDFLPHSSLLVGYDATSFYYYETVCLEGTSLEPGVRSPGLEGIRVSEAKLLEAVASQAKGFGLPWRYSFALFEPWPIQSELGPVWRRNAKLLMGGEKYGPMQGAAAIEQTAQQVQRQWHRSKLSELDRFLQAAIYTRHDNADFLRARSVGDERMARAANLLSQAAQNYGCAHRAIHTGIHSQTEADQVAKCLTDAATAEWEVGSIFARVASSPDQPVIEIGVRSENSPFYGGGNGSHSADQRPD